jgi:predicted RNase H-like HicB family nuclease
MQYTIILEQGKKNNYGASVPDLPGCIAVGETKREVLQLIQEAVEFHLEGLKEDGLPIPSPHCSSVTIDVNVAR